MSENRIGILGSGDVGRALGAGFARHGWDVLVGTRHPESLESWRDGLAQPVALGSFGDAAGYGDVAVLAVKGEFAERVLDLAGPERFGDALVSTRRTRSTSRGGCPPDCSTAGRTPWASACRRRSRPPAL